VFLFTSSTILYRVIRVLSRRDKQRPQMRGRAMRVCESPADSRQQTADSRQQTADSRQYKADSRRQTADSRQQTADSRQ
jgi:hypothetical protein